MKQKILMIGGGNFLRAFVPPQTDAEITIVKATERGDYTDLREQNGRYHIVVRGLQDGEPVNRLELVDNVTGVLHPWRKWADFLASAEDPAINTVVSNTTESGIRFFPDDLAREEAPRGFPGFLCRWLQRKYASLPDARVTLLPCELIVNNGDRLREMVLRYAEGWQLPEDFRNWIRSHGTFCNTLVDRIVSGFPADAAAIQEKLPFEDRLLTVAEPFSSWVIAGVGDSRLPFRSEHLTLTDDLDKYRILKVRILNGLHILMVAMGLPAGIKTVREFVENDRWGAWLDDALREEIIPSLPYPTAECEAYAATVLERFRNPFLEHQLSSIALNKEDKFRVRVEPSIEAYEKEFGREAERLVAARKALVNQLPDTTN